MISAMKPQRDAGQDERGRTVGLHRGHARKELFQDREVRRPANQDYGPDENGQSASALREKSKALVSLVGCFAHRDLQQLQVTAADTMFRNQTKKPFTGRNSARWIQRRLFR